MTVATRTTARVLPVDGEGRVLLLHRTDAEKAYWFTIGGGVEPGEGLVEAAVRELAEETGIVVPAEALTGPIHVGRREHTVDGTDRVDESTCFAVRLDHDVTVDFGGHPEDEADWIDDARWWDPADLASVPLGHPALPGIARAAVEAVRAGEARA